MTPSVLDCHAGYAPFFCPFRLGHERVSPRMALLGGQQEVWHEAETWTDKRCLTWHLLISKEKDRRPTAINPNGATGRVPLASQVGVCRKPVAGTCTLE